YRKTHKANPLLKAFCKPTTLKIINVTKHCQYGPILKNVQKTGSKRAKL
ncbi:MAG: hypothetical protein ACI92E_002515, partial [Oceanicoccus sp.]